MGEVYKSRDTRLDRVVAIKILTSDIADDASLRARFEREARAIAALDHPHICSIYDVGEANGTLFLVMPYLDGQTLAARLEHGALPLDHTLKIAAEIADALDKAHRQGIIHRDVKPANIMLTKAGSKLLDFGIAKLKAPAGSMAGMTGVETATLATAQGTILGTVQYMAPEQLEGKDADPRSDIWALGAVIYEMTTGTRPFAGDTPASVIAAILKDRPPSISMRQPPVPWGLNYVADRCLAKDPEERWQSIGDVGRMLRGIASNQAVEAEPHARRRDRWKERTAWMVATALLLTALAFATPWRKAAVPTGEVARLSVNPPEQLAFVEHAGATVPTPQFALSPDGQSIAFVAAEPAGRPRSGCGHWKTLMPETARDGKCVRAVLVSGQPVDWVFRRTRQDEEGCRVRGNRVPNHRQPCGSSWRLMGSRRHDSVRDRVWRSVPSRGGWWDSRSRDRPGHVEAGGLAPLAAVPAGWPAFSLHREKCTRRTEGGLRQLA